MDPHIVALIAAVIGIVATIVWIAFGLKGLRILREISDHLRQRRHSD